MDHIQELLPSYMGWITSEGGILKGIVDCVHQIKSYFLAPKYLLISLPMGLLGPKQLKFRLELSLMSTILMLSKLNTSDKNVDIDPKPCLQLFIIYD